MQNEDGCHSIPPTSIVEGYTFPACPSASSTSSDSTHHLNLLEDTAFAQYRHQSNVALLPVKLQPSSPNRTKEWIENVASCQDSVSEKNIDCGANANHYLQGMPQPPQTHNGRHSNHTNLTFGSLETGVSTTYDDTFESPSSTSSNLPTSICTPLPASSTSLDKLNSPLEMMYKDGVQQSTITSSDRAQLHRQRSSHDSALNVTIEHTAPPTMCANSDPVKPDQHDLEEHQLSLAVALNSSSAFEKTVPNQQRFRAPRRAFSMTDIGHHDHDHSIHPNAGTAGTKGSAFVQVPNRRKVDACRASLSGLERISEHSIDKLGQRPTPNLDTSFVQEGLALNTINREQRDVGPSPPRDVYRMESLSEAKSQPPTVTVTEATSVSLAAVYQSFQGPASHIVHPVTHEIVAYNPRFPHPAIVYAALSGRDDDLFKYFNENGMFVDTLYRRTGTGARQVLLQDGEEMTFPTLNNETGSPRKDVNETNEEESVFTTANGLPGLESRNQANVQGPIWEDDHVFGSSTTSGMNHSEAMQQMLFLRKIHFTAQQPPTELGNDELMQQAKDIFKYIGELTQLTEFVRARQVGIYHRQKDKQEHDSECHFGSQTQSSRTSAPRFDAQKRSSTKRDGRNQPRYTDSHNESQLHARAGCFDDNAPSRQGNVLGHGIGPRLCLPNNPFLPYSLPTPAPLPYYRESEMYNASYPIQPFLLSSVSPIHIYDGSWSPPVPPLASSTMSNYTLVDPCNMQGPPAYKSDICRTYWIHGECPYGSRCFFLHTPPSAQWSVPWDTAARLEDASSGKFLQSYQDQYNIDNLKFMLQAGYDIVPSTVSALELSIPMLLARVDMAPLRSDYTGMPLSYGGMIPMYPLNPVHADSITSTSFGHFIRLPSPTGASPSNVGAHPNQTQPYSNLLPKQYQIERANSPRIIKKTTQTPQAKPLGINARRFSTAGPLQPRKSSPCDPPSSGVGKAYSEAARGTTNLIKRPTSRSLRQVKQTTLQESSLGGTRLAVAGQRTNGPQIAAVIDQIESRMSTRLT
ncbi:hypothetical protein QFC19_006261 [Naganishia cerealis]|uniref:Uncharacterized protein n=1 Tax=Naganishia cerealis TaxID=610337 RepID=A0ACC2VHB5_9TREE|nr:hypothetical protein QFC19_006261 [Naganishia cerealis]